MEIPRLETNRLVLRPFDLIDAPTVQKLAGNFKIAETTANIPHPYENGVAEAWIKTHERCWLDRNLLNLAMVNKASKELIGCISLIFSSTHQRAELAYWVGEPYWSKGYCTEASAALISYAFEYLHLRKITAHHMLKNPASGKVMEKLGMKKEGQFEKHYLRFGEFLDMVGYGLLKENFVSRSI